MLTDSQVKALKPKDKMYSLADGEGLSIDVLPNGKKKWTLSYRAHGKQSRKRIGDYPDIGCKDARRIAREVKKELTGKAIKQKTLKEVIDEWLALQTPYWTSDKYRDTVIYRLNYISANFGDRLLDDITRQDVSASVKAIVAKGTLETATRALRLLNSVFNFAISSDYTDKNPCILVNEIIPPHDVQHYPSLPVEEMPEFFRRLKFYSAHPSTKTALILACYTGVRISELLNARFDTGEFDFDNKIWTIPAFRMKKRKDLLVPLSDDVLAIFKTLYDTRIDDGYLFKNRNDPRRAMTSNAVLQIIKRLGYEGEMVTHGFRTLFSTHANNSRRFRTEVIDFQIAHVNKSTKADATSKIYNRAEYWDERVELMDWYSEEVTAWLGDFWD
ncbi:MULTISPECIES: tyrosine-type recombinase/integrase [Moraxella]|uniref:Prophage CP4-like integrase n=1 Tax=Moraxella catarrhalis TaxID=480 RepID=A0A7Z1A3J8_MORCA|nr:tyrosine-type recombinase/integrase [Moraxella catarrhalis]OAV00257.1 prophage CP4-like integrase [Moraxella catarrhalis]STY82524.1 Putative prophage CPS-53 integrase [Moraxella catarrhalis]